MQQYVPANKLLWADNPDLNQFQQQQMRERLSRLKTKNIGAFQPPNNGTPQIDGTGTAMDQYTQPETPLSGTGETGFSPLLRQRLAQQLRAVRGY